jgi:hypothetical protein
MKFPELSKPETLEKVIIFKRFFIFVDLFGQNAEKDFVAFERPFET